MDTLIESGNLDIISSFITRKIEPVTEEQLLDAIIVDNLDLVKLFVDLDCFDRHQLSECNVLDYAIECGDSILIKELLEHGVEVLVSHFISLEVYGLDENIYNLLNSYI